MNDSKSQTHIYIIKKINEGRYSLSMELKLPANFIKMEFMGNITTPKIEKRAVPKIGQILSINTSTINICGDKIMKTSISIDGIVYYTEETYC